MPGRLGGGLVLLDREQRHAEAVALHPAREQHRAEQHAERDEGVGAVVGELHVGDRVLAHHRQRHFLVAQPLEDVEQRERIGEHGEREIVAAQAEGRQADGKARDPAEHGGDRDQHVGRPAEVRVPQRGGIGAQPEEGRVPERHQAGVAAEHVPREAEAGPDQHQREHELVIGVAHQRGGERVGEHEAQHGVEGAAAPALRCAPRCGRRSPAAAGRR